MALVASVACKGKSDDDKPPANQDLSARCDQLAKACGDNEKHVAKVAEECRQVAVKQRTHNCADQALAEYDCYEKELCGKGDKVWTLDDLRVLTERHGKCTAQRDAARACVEK